MHIKGIFSTAFLLCFLLPLSSERYQISEISYSLEKTRAQDLRRIVPVNTTKIFENKSEFDSYMADLHQRLMNKRAFQKVDIEFNTIESSSFDTESAPPPFEEEIIQISLNITAEDTKHLLILPYPKYDSNDGLIFKIKVKDVNFLGTMNTMDAAVFAGLKEDLQTGNQNPIFGAEFKYSYPFLLGAFLGSWNNNFDLRYTTGIKELEFWTGTGFTFELPFQRFSLVLDLSEQFNRDLEYDFYNDTQFFTSDLNFSVPVKICDIENWGYVFWTPYTDAKINYDKNGINKLNDDLASPVISAGEKLSTSRINWYGNFRNGLSVSLAHAIAYDFMQKEWEPRVSFELQAFKAFKYIAFNTRINAFLTKSNRSTVGELIRGIRDKQKYLNANLNDFRTERALKTPSAIVMNLDIPVHIIETHWLDWSNLIFGEESWFSKTFAWTDKFNFELQASPFLDIALTKNESTGRLFSTKDGWYAGGIEFLCFPEHWKGIVMRASLGIDLGRKLISKKLPEKIDMSWRSNVKSYEIYAGIGLHY